MPAVMMSLRFLAYLDARGVEVGGPEGLRDDDIGGGQLTLEDGVRTLLVAGDHELVTGLLQEGTEAELPGPRSCPGVKSIAEGVGTVWPPEYSEMTGISDRA